MNKNTGILIGVVALVIIVGGGYASSMGNKKDDAMIDNKEDKSVAIKEEATKEDEMMKKEDKNTQDNVLVEGEVMMKGSYEDYSLEKLARAENGDVVLFFHASWCPSCRAINSDIENNRDSIPEGISILKLDYDKETELKKKYGVTYQHTFVQVDKDGNLIKKWSGSPKLSNLISEIQ